MSETEGLWAPVRRLVDRTLRSRGCEGYGDTGHGSSPGGKFAPVVPNSVDVAIGAALASDPGCMGIRYYAYAFDADLAQRAVDDPHSILSSDPLADAWGLEPHAAVSVATFEQVVPKRDMLYLDKAWRALQALTRPTSDGGVVRASYRMFEGNVTMHGLGWDPWVRTILPEEVPAICDDLCAIDEDRVRAWARTWRSPHGADDEAELRYVLDYLGRSQEFVESLAIDDRGMVYLIG